MSASTFTRDFVEGFAQLITASVDPTFALTWSTTAKYTANQIGIYVASFPVDVTGQPAVGRAIALAAYPLTDDATFGDSEIGLQVRTRAAGPDIRQAWEIDDAIADALLGRFCFTLPTGIAVTSLTRSVSTSLGKDDSNRWVWSSSYPALVHRPTAHRL